MRKTFTLILLLLALLAGSSCSSGKTAALDAMADRLTQGTAAGRIVFCPVARDTAAGEFFEISHRDGKVLISGNTRSALSSGLNWYLKYVAGIHLSWNNPTQPLPEPLPLPKETIRRETSMQQRYYLNYCTYSYSMAFWDWPRWEQELDWMALHGINMPLSMTGIEVVWRNVLRRLDYTDKEIDDFISGPAYMAWWQMNNLEGWGGPNPAGWYDRQEALQKKIVARMRELGIEPVFPGYSGMVPRNIGEKLGYHIADPGKWCGFPRPAFLSPEDEHFPEVAAIYYEELEKLYGKSRYYSMDPFHEGGNTGGIDLSKAGEAIMSAMKKANPEAVWVVQAWQENPRRELMKNLEAGDLLVLDLYSEKRPQWGDPKSVWCRKEGFGRHDWAYCMLLNFGGNVGLHGRMDQLVDGYYDARAHANGKTLRGVGATPEGIENNPVMFELIYELPWRDERFDTDEWLRDYLTARYGGTLQPAVWQAWQKLKHTVYNAPMDYPGEGTVESLLCARPGLRLDRTSTWGCSKLFYDADSTIQAAQAMLSAADSYAGNDNFHYDLVDILRQSNADKANRWLAILSDSYDKRDVQTFKTYADAFSRLMLRQDSLLSTRKEFCVDTWLNRAASLGVTPEERQLYVRNAAMLITVWGDSVAANRGGLHDYSHREWGGLMRDLYCARWNAFLSGKLSELETGVSATLPDFYEMEQGWVEKTVQRYE